MYIDLKTSKPKEGDKVWVSVSKNPLNPKPAIFKKGKFWDVNDEDIQYYPTHWKYPNVPFAF